MTYRYNFEIISSLEKGANRRHFFVFFRTRVTDKTEITEMPISLLNLFESSGVTAVKDQLMFCPLQEKMTEKVAAKAKNLFVPIFWWKLHEII